jgi:hypothetical protein
VALYALSYDEPDALADFARAHGIGFPLLADPGSDVIRRFGILNTLIPEDDAPWFGVPFPGTYVVDGAGAIVAKFFENSLAIRPGPEQLLRVALGGEFDAAPAPEPVEVEVRAYLDGPHLAPGLTRELTVELRIPEGLHVYGPPVPDGMVATTLELDPSPRVLALPVRTPPTRPHRLASGETLAVYDGVVRLRVPVTVTGVLTSDDGADIVTLSGTVRYQCCDDQVCLLPVSVPFRVDVPVEPAIVGDLGRGGARSRPMNGAAHFQRMVDRRRQG